MKKFPLCILVMIAGLGCGYSKPMASAPQPGAVPAITALSPTSTSAGSRAFVLTVNGSGFATDAKVVFNGTQLTTTFLTANQVIAMIPASAIAAPEAAPVTVTNPAHAGGGIYGTGGTTAETSSPMNFTVN